MDENTTDPSAATITNLNKMIADLESKLEDSTASLDEMTEKAASLEHQLDGNAAGWSRHRDWTEDGLPVPRLELRWSRNGDRSATALYVMVYRHHTGEIVGVPMGRTRVDGGSAQRFVVAADGKIALPMRDGVHLWADARQMQLPAYVTTEDGDAAEIDLYAVGTIQQKPIRTGTPPNPAK